MVYRKKKKEEKGPIVLSAHCRTYPALETLTEPHQLTATLSCMIGVARSLVSGEQRFPEGPTHMLPLLMRALPGVDPNDFSKCMVCSTALCLLSRSLMFLKRFPHMDLLLCSDKNIISVLIDHIPVYCYICDSCAFGRLFICPA